MARGKKPIAVAVATPMKLEVVFFDKFDIKIQCRDNQANLIIFLIEISLLLISFNKRNDNLIYNLHEVNNKFCLIHTQFAYLLYILTLIFD